MADFAATGLVRLMVRVLGDMDPALVEGIGCSGPMAGAVEPDAGKRLLIARTLSAHGPGPLLAVGQALHLIDEAPLHAALLASADPAVLADKWMRLERYFHASHRTRIVARPGGWFCRRYAGDAVPGVGENCLVAGLLFGLVGRIGVTGARLIIAGQTLAPEDLAAFRLPETETAEVFAIGWESVGAVQPQPGPAHDGDLADRLADLMAADAGRAWRIETVADLAALAPRTLQRRLTEAGWTFSALLRRARMRAASQLLSKPTVTLAEIGYCCGYADQAHFQRDFRRMTNMTPNAFRRQALATGALATGVLAAGS